jgi:hypothetical protein
MNKKFISLLVVSLAFVSGCVKSASSVSSESSKSESASQSVSASQSSSSSQSSSESKSESKSESNSSSDGTISNPITILPADAPAKDTATNTYPADAEYTVGGAKFEFSKIMKGSQQPLDKDDKTIKTNINLMQSAGEDGTIYNTEKLNVTKITMVFLNKVSTYNNVYPIESVYTGDVANPATTKAPVVTPVSSLTSEGYKIFTQEFTFTTPVSFFTIKNDDYYHADEKSTFRAVYFFSITIALQDA